MQSRQCVEDADVGLAREEWRVDDQLKRVVDGRTSEIEPIAAAENDFIFEARGRPRKPDTRPKIFQGPSVVRKCGVGVARDAGGQGALEIRGGNKSGKRTIREIVGSECRPEIHKLARTIRSLSYAFPAQTGVYGEVRVQLDVVLREAVQATDAKRSRGVATEIVGNEDVA